MKNYYLGFDIGTSSIGWATTDEEYNLLKARGQDFWGTYLFDEAQTAESRRMSRTARRRLARKRGRIKLLQELFAEEIAKADFCFFERLNNSKYALEDKSDGIRYDDNLFHDANFTDKDFHTKYPTVYHLRRDLLDKDKAREIKDIRILYLAVAHIIKHRGHFLFEGKEIKAGDKEIVKGAFDKIRKILESMFDGALELSLDKLSEALDVVSDKNTTKSDKERKLKNLLGTKGDGTREMLVKAMVGGKVSVKKLFKESETDVKDFSFNDDGFVIEQLKDSLSEDEYALICEAKTVYDWAVLSQILGEHKYISEAMCAKFDRHKEDKQWLKEYIRANFGKEKYNEMFSYRAGVANYAAYVGKDRDVNVKPCKKEDFYAYLKSIVKDNAEIMQRIEDGTFLEKQRTNANGVIPYQLHLTELELILQNASQNFPFLNEMQDGYSVKDKIIALMTFRIPYYVGPLNDAHSDGKNGFAWVKKHAGTQNVKITPWNFKQVVDEQACEDAFIERMTNKCSYLIGEDVLPKQSLLYSEFAFLNELNNVTYKGNRLDKSAREAILNHAKANRQKITRKQIGKILENNGLIEKGEGKEENFAGIDKEIKSNFSSYIFLKCVLGDDFDVDMCEDIIRCFTIMGDKGSMRATERIKRQYNLDDEVVKQLKGWSCSGWGRLSKEFLDGEAIYTVSKESGEMLTIIQAMRETGCNLMELLSNKYDFSANIEKYNAQYRNDGKVTYETIEDLYCSPSVKRAIWRTVCLAREIEKVQGCPPSRIFIEMARGEDKDKKPTKSRKEQMLDLYKSIKDEERAWHKEIEATEDRRFLSDKLYLYYMQMGRSAYSGKPIRIEEALDTNICDIDHIYPQSKIKDDSVINNKVLCFKTENSAKQDVYPLSQDVRHKMMPIWTMWHNRKLISDEKFKRLTRNTPLSSEELDAFIARQIVSTRQSTKEVANILKQMYPDAQIVYSKAGNVVEFKNTVNSNKHVEDIIKVRDLNDLHHAKDAYLNIVVGNVYYTKFNRFYQTTTKENTLKTDEEKKNGYDLRKLFYENIYGAWNPAMMRKVCQIANRNTPKVVRFTSSGHGQLWEATIKRKGTNSNLVPLKHNGILEKIDKYGGYDAAATSHFALVESLDKKGKRLISLEPIPIYVTLLGKCAITNFLKENVKLKQPRILIDKIKKNSLVKFNGAYYWLKGKTEDRIILCNANQLVLDGESTAYLKKVCAFKDKKTKQKNIEPSFEFDKISKAQNVALYDTLCQKLSHEPYINLITMKKQCALLEEKRETFVQMDEKSQVDLIMAVLHFMQCNGDKSDLTLIGGKSGVGEQKRSKKIDENEEALLITQSPTGYYRETIDLTVYYRQ